jgi:hypothetical protein
VSYIYIVELEFIYKQETYMLGKFEDLYQAFNYIENYSKTFGFSMIKEYTHLLEDQRNGSLISVKNLKKPTKHIYVRSEINKKRKLTM